MKLSEKVHQAYYDNLTSRGRKLKRKRKQLKRRHKLLTGKGRTADVRRQLEGNIPRGSYKNY
jgi:hypothetical protein